MRKLEKVISLLLIISMVFCSTGFNTLANSLYEKDQNSIKMLEQLKEDLGEERVNNIINEQIEEVELCESINEDEMSQNLEKSQNFTDIENIENDDSVSDKVIEEPKNEYDEEPEKDLNEEEQLEDIEKNENRISENEVANKDLLDLNDDVFDSENKSNEKKEFENEELEEVNKIEKCINEIETIQDNENDNVEVEKLEEIIENENNISEDSDTNETSLDFVESDEIIDGTNDLENLEKENSSLDDSEKNIEKLGESEKESSTQLEKGKMNEVIEESTYESRLEQNINEKENIDLLESSNLIKETNDDQELEKVEEVEEVEEVKEENIDIVELANDKVNGDKLKDETTIDRLDENTIASVNETTKDVANVLFGSGNNVYWYLTEAGATLHLSGEEPTASEYSTTGGTNYDKNSVTNKTAITQVVIDNPIHPTNCESWFGDFENLLTIEYIENLDTSEVVDMTKMFYSCESLTNLDLSSFVTSEVTNMELMFQYCRNLMSLDVSSFNTSKVTDMNRMFSTCRSLTNIDVRGFDTSKVTNMENMFAYCENMQTLDVSDFVTNEVTKMASMFLNCGSLTSLDVSNFVTSEVTNMSSMFNGCSNLTSLDVSNFNTSKVQYIFSMFSGCSSLTNLDVSSFDTRQVTNIQMMFNGCSGLTYLDLSNFIIDAVEYDRITNMLNNCNNLKHIKISESVSNKINEMSLTGDWVDASTNIIYYYSGSQTTIPTGVAGIYGRPLTISFETNGGTIKSDMVVAYGNKIATPTDVIKTGYYVENWCIDNLLTNVWDFENDVITSDMTFYAKWSLAFYFINYNTNGGIVSPTQIIKTYTENVTLDTPTKTGYTFEGWFTDNNTFINQYDGTTDLSNTYREEVDIYAKWTAISYTINYNANGGSISSAQIAKTYGVDVVPDTPIKIGYTFEGWFTDDNTFLNQFVGTTDLSSTQGAVVDIYAKWTLTTYIIKYNANGGTVSPTQIIKTYTLNITLDIPTKIGYTFAGWFIDNNTFLNQYDGMIDLSNIQDDEVEIYAKWSENSYILKLNPNPVATDETLVGTETSETLTYTQMKTLANPFISSKYNFLEWRTNADGTGASYVLNQEVNKLASGNGEVVTLYAKWEAGTYKVRYVGNGATYGSMEDSSFACDGEVALSTNSFVKKGYRFNKWTENSDGSGASFTDGQLVTNLFNAKKGEIKNLYANWVLATYTIKYNANGGYVSPTHIAKTYSENVTLATPSKVGYHFAGWYIDNGTFLNLYDGITDLADTQDAVVEIYAKWVLDSSYVEVTFDSNGGNAVDTQTVKKGVEKVTRPVDPTKEGYIFVDWYKETEFINVWDFDNEIVNANMTLYAKWESLTTKYTVIFNSNGGSPVASVDVNKGEKVARPVSPRKSGYIFVNWYKEAQLISRFDFNTVITSDITLYAKWVKYTPSGGGSGGGGGGGNVISQRGPIKESAIIACEKSKNINKLNNDLIKWNYDPIRKIWELDVTVNGERVSYKYGYAIIDNHTYYFDEKGNMVTGWVKDLNGDYYAFEWQKTANEGMMLYGWRLVNDKWYYFMESGKLLINDVTPDGYKVDAEGIWIK